MFEFTVGRREVISGWDEGIQKILLGSKVKATISPVRCHEFTTSNIFRGLFTHNFKYIELRSLTDLLNFVHRTKHMEIIHQMIQCQRMQLYFLTSNY